MANESGRRTFLLWIEEGDADAVARMLELTAALMIAASDDAAEGQYWTGQHGVRGAYGFVGPQAVGTLAGACEAVLLFHRGGRWTPECAARWEQLTGSREATNKVLCDTVRRALAGTLGEGGERDGQG